MPTAPAVRPDVAGPGERVLPRCVPVPACGRAAAAGGAPVRRGAGYFPAPDNFRPGVIGQRAVCPRGLLERLDPALPEQLPIIAQKFMNPLRRKRQERREQNLQVYRCSAAPYRSSSPPAPIFLDHLEPGRVIQVGVDFAGEGHRFGQAVAQLDRRQQIAYRLECRFPPCSMIARS